jgi:hypothetical protein
MSWLAIRDAHGQDAIFQTEQLPIQDRTIPHGNRGCPRIEIDPLDLLKIHVSHTAVFIGELESLVEESQDAAFGFRAVLELDHVRPGTEGERNPNANWQYLSHRRGCFAAGFRPDFRPFAACASAFFWRTNNDFMRAKLLLACP